MTRFQPVLRRQTAENNFFCRIVRCFSTGCVMQKESGKKTVLYDLHVEKGGKMVNFAGWQMPVQYSNMGIIQSHRHTREKSSLFDVSHMLQTKIYGKDKEKFLESLVVADICEMKPNTGGLSVFTNEHGGILDDVIVNTTDDEYLYIVSNAGCSDKISNHLESKVEASKSQGLDVDVQHIDYGLIALQGPSAARVMASASNDDVSKMGFMTSRVMKLNGVEGCRVTRCGYTGEDGFEISIPKQRTVELAEKLLSHNDVELAGLGARDSLRLEAGLCLYGNDIDESTNPVEAALTWCIGKRRRKEGGFPGSTKIIDEIKQKPKQRRVGLVIDGGIARNGAVIEDEEGKRVGHVTSGCPSPSLGVNIAMGYLPVPLARVGTPVRVRVRKRVLSALVTRMPFLPTNYYYVT